MALENQINLVFYSLMGELQKGDNLKYGEYLAVALPGGEGPILLVDEAQVLVMADEQMPQLLERLIRREELVPSPLVDFLGEARVNELPLGEVLTMCLK